MARAARLLASATVGSVIALGVPMLASAQTGPSPGATALSRTSATSGAIAGTVRDDRGQPIADVVVSALGATTTIAVTGKDGRFEFGPLAPGPYLLRAHLAGYLASRAQTGQVNAGAQATSVIQLGRGDAVTAILAAVIGGQ